MNSYVFVPYRLSDEIALSNKIIMAPMTRRRADVQGCQPEEMVRYYARRADAGLIVTEGTLISADAIGYGNVPGIYTDKHIQSWRRVTDAVHAKGGKIFVQLWHCGRVSHPIFHEGRLPVSASATHMTGPLGNSGYDCGTARAATIDEIKGLIEDFAQASEHAMQAGFDGVEIHGANGYLIDQFLHCCTNQRDDAYGGSPENQARFAIEVVQACCDRIGSGRVGLRLSPGGHFSQITSDPKDAAVFQALLQALVPLDIAYVHTGAFDDSVVYPELAHLTMTQFLRRHYPGTVITCGGYDLAAAETWLAQHSRNLIALGRPFIANPDLIARIKSKQDWQSYDPALLQAIT